MHRLVEYFVLRAYPVLGYWENDERYRDGSERADAR